MPTRRRKLARDAMLMAVIGAAALGLLRTTSGLGGLPPPLPPSVDEPPPRTAAASPSPRITPLTGAGLTGAKLYLSSGRQALVVDLAGGSVQTLPVPGAGRLSWVSRQGSAVVFLRAGTASVLRDGAREPVRVGEAEDVLPSADPSRLWLVRKDFSGPVPAWAMTAVHVWGAAARSEPVLLPPGLRPVAAVDGDTAVVVSNGMNRSLAVHDLPRAGADIGRRRALWHEATFVDSIGSLVAHVDGQEELHLTDVRTGADRTVARPAGVRGWTSSAGLVSDACCRRHGAFSPGGRLLAVTLRDGSGQDEIGLVRTDTLAVSGIPSSSGALRPSCLPCFDWLPGGGWLLFAFGEPSVLGAYRLGGEVSALGIQAPPVRLSFAVR